MFPTFISILDIQSWWEVPSIAHFCSLFRSAFNLLDFDIEDLEEALLTDGTEETSWLQELIVRLLSGCIANNEISTFNYQMFLRRLFRQKCQEHDRYNPFNTDIDFTLLPLKTKVDILHALCDFRLDADDVLDQLKNLEADSLRVEPLGYDTNDSAYWYFYGTRLYREDFKTKNNKKKSIWQVICFTEEDWFQLTKKFKSSTSKAERNLYHTLSKNFLPELPRLFKEKERQARRRLLENQPRRTSNRLRKSDSELEEHEKKVLSPSKEDIEKRRTYEQELNDRRGIREDSDIESDEGDENMARTKQRKQQPKKRRDSDESSETSKDNVSTSKTKRSKKSERSDSPPPKVSKPATVGRQTNNSLSAADGQIVIQPLANTTKKKLKTSQVFRQTDEDLQVGMHKILDFVKNDEDAWPFADPVEEEYAPNYYTVIRKPMDLQKMEERLDNCYYRNFDKFKADFHLIVANCRLYNGAENEYTKMVNNLQKVFERATEKYLDQISSSEDEIAVEYLESKNETKSNKKRRSETPPVTTRGRKQSLGSGNDKKRDKSEAKENRKYSEAEESAEEEKGSKKSKKVEKIGKKEEKTKKKVEKTETKKEKPEKEQKKSKKTKIDPKKAKLDSKKEKQKLKKSKSKKSHKKTKKRQSPARSASSSDRSRSPSPVDSFRSSSPPSTPEKVDASSKKQRKKKAGAENNEVPPKESKKPSSKWNDLFEEKDQRADKKFKDEFPPYLPVPTSPKPKDKHNKLRETIEKLKAKSEISRIKSPDYDFDILVDLPKENKEKTKKEKEKGKNKERNGQKASKKEAELDEHVNIPDNEPKKPKKTQNKSSNPPDNKTASNFDALSIATEQTLKDINKWLDDTPKFAAEFSSASNSPSYGGLDDFDALTVKIDSPLAKKPSTDKTIPTVARKDATKDVKRKPFRDPSKFFKRREVQRTIDRLQPGKGKGNLISNVQNSVGKADEIFPLGPLAKMKDTKNSLIVKTDTNAPKLSLGSVLDSFGKHKFVDDQKKEEEDKKEVPKPAPTSETPSAPDKKEDKPETTKPTEKEAAEDPNAEGGATPNLSAWFKAFGAPKPPPPVKKSEKNDGKENDKEEPKEKVALPDPSPSADSPQPVRQRRTSTGSSMSERSSFSQDLDSPRVGIDERAPFPYPSPSGASPRPEFSPKYPSFNGQMRVGFYQDTVSNKSSPDKSCSPNNPPQSPYIQYSSDHVYAPNTTQNALYTYGTSPYYSHAPNYSSTNPTPPYNMDANNPQYFDTTKSHQYPINSPASNHSSPHSPIVHPQLSPSVQSVHSPGVHSPSVHSQHSPSVNSPQNSPMVRSPMESPNSPHGLQIVQQQQVRSPSVQNDNFGQTEAPEPLKLDKPQQQIPQQPPQIQQQPPQIPQQPPQIPQQPPQIQQQPAQIQQQPPQIQPQPQIQQQTVQTQQQPVQIQQQPVQIQQQPVQIQQQPAQMQQQPPQIPQQQLHQQQQLQQKILHQQTPMFPVKKRVYNDSDPVQFNLQEYELKLKTVQQELVNRNLLLGQQISLGVEGQKEAQKSSEAAQNKGGYPSSAGAQIFTENLANFALNVPSTRSLNAQPKIDMSKFTNMGYSGPEVNYSRALQQQYARAEINYTREAGAQGSVVQTQGQQGSATSQAPQQPTTAFKSMTNTQQAHSNTYNTTAAHQNQQRNSENISERLSQMQENVSNIIDRFGNDDRILAGLQTTSSYYADKGLGTAMFNKNMPIFSQANVAAMQQYSQNVQATQVQQAFSRQVNEMQAQVAQAAAQAVAKNAQAAQVAASEKKPKNKRKSSKPASTVQPTPGADPQAQQHGFQSYANLKPSAGGGGGLDPLKSSPAVAGSAFNFAAGLDAYPNFLEEFRAGPNYYMAAAAAAPLAAKDQRGGGGTQAAAAGQGFGFLGAAAAAQGRAGAGYPIGSPFISPTAQAAQLMDTGSPLYQHYLQAGVLNQGLLAAPPSAYPPGYHTAAAALNMRQAYDSMAGRAPWL